MCKKAVVFDNSGTLTERYRVIKNIEKDKLFTDLSSQEIVMASSSHAMVVLQFDSVDLCKIDPDYLISDYIKENSIDFDLSFSTSPIGKDKIKKVLENEKEATVKDITDTFPLLKSKIPDFEICNGSALIIDFEREKIIYTITSAGKLFERCISTVNTLKNNGFEIFIASGDRSGAISKLTDLLEIPKKNGFPTSSSYRKCEIVKKLQSKGYNVTMVGDGANDIKAFKKSDISILTLEQEDEVSNVVLDKTDYVVNEISEIIEILI